MGSWSWTETCLTVLDVGKLNVKVSVLGEGLLDIYHPMAEGGRGKKGLSLLLLLLLHQFYPWEWRLHDLPTS